VKDGLESHTLDDVLDGLIDQIDARSSPLIETGFTDIDYHLGGLRPSELAVLASKPGVGKTALAMALARNLASANVPTLFLSLEMSRDDFVQRLAGTEARVEARRLRGRLLSADDMNRLAAASAVMRPWPLHVSAPAVIDVQGIRDVVADRKAEAGIRAVFVDGLHRIEPRDRRPPRHEQVSETVRDLKRLAREFDVAVVLTAQVGRGADASAGRCPKLSDLRESSAVEEDADVVLFLHRPELYCEYDRPSQADLFIAKHRNGKTGIVTLRFDARSVSFQDIILDDLGS
jgi:replicative DNA helicase